VEILDRLAGREDVVTALLTGNWEPGAKAKLSRFGLDRYFAFGAFGCDGVDRSELPPVALDRAERATGRRFRPQDVLIVGDSLHDVSCAHAHGIPCLAVGTGRTPEEVLQAAGADWVIGDLRQAGRAVPWLG
jgi:phosphoglycolate phosphatase